MLQNRIYLGEIVHKDQNYPGEHAAIIETDLWDEVQTRLRTNAVERSSGARSRLPSLLAGLLFDADGNRMTPTHAVKHGQRYRYYISHPLTTGARQCCPTGLRLPAVELERVVSDRIREFLGDPSAVFDVMAGQRNEPDRQAELIDRAVQLARSWPAMLSSDRRGVVTRILAKVEVREAEVVLLLIRSRLVSMLLAEPIPVYPATNNPVPGEAPMSLHVSARLKRIGPGIKLVVNDAGVGRRNPDPAMIALLAKAHRLHGELTARKYPTIDIFAANQGLTRSYVTRLLRFAFLAPDIIRAILHGEHPPALTTSKLCRISELPIDWQRQRIALGFR